MADLRRRRRFSRFNNLMLWLHYAVMISLIIALAAKYISPALFWLPAFFGLAFPMLFALNLLFTLYWAAQVKRVTLFGIVLLLFSLPTALRYVQFSRDTRSANKPLKITSFNCMLFDLYNWNNNRQSRNHMIELLREQNPDILCLQEFYTSEDENDFNNIDTLRRVLRTDFFHTEYTVTLRKNDHWGIATFSKYPVVNQGRILFNTRSNNICIFTDIVAGRDTLRVYNVHLQSISFSKSDNKFLADILSDEDAEDEMANSKNILRRLKRAFVKRTAQVEMIRAHMATSPYKIVVCGDFNDTAASYAYETLSEDLEDAFVRKGNGFGRTYAGKWPQFRIDYILYDPALHCGRYYRSDETFSDHFPITAHFDNIRWQSP